MAPGARCTRIKRVSQDLPGARYEKRLDAAGNLKRVTPPSRPAYGFDYTPVDHLINDVLLNVPLQGIDGVNSSALFPSLWEVLLAPVVLAILGILILRIIRLKIVGSYFVLISSFCLNVPSVCW